MQRRFIHIVLLLFLGLLFTQPMTASPHLSAPVSADHAGNNAVISMPMAAAVAIERTELSGPASPYTLVVRSRRTITYRVNPSPVYHELTMSHHYDSRRCQALSCRYRYQNLNFPPYQISIPFSQFW